VRGLIRLASTVRTQQTRSEDRSFENSCADSILNRLCGHRFRGRLAINDWLVPPQREKEFFETGSKRGISPELAARIARRLDALEAAQELRDIDAHGFNLHLLKGERHGECAISVSGNWRITFKFEKGEALDINLEDYH
jgi:toxin HigB-1